VLWHELWQQHCH